MAARWRWLVGLLVVLLLLVGAAPYIAQWNPLRDWLIGSAMGDIDGTVTTGSADFGWFSPPVVRDLTIADAQGQPVVSIESFQGDTDLWRIATGSAYLGTYTVQKPRVQVTFDEGRANLVDVFHLDQSKEGPPPAVPEILRGRTLGLSVVDASVSVRPDGAPQSWQSGKIGLKVRLEPPGDGSDVVSVLVVERGMLLDRTELTPGLCNDLLKYIAPVVAGATQTEGAVSVELDDWRVPLDDLPRATGAGTLNIHLARVTAGGPLVKQIAALLGVSPSVDLIDNSAVAFRVADGRVYHQGLQFGMPGYRIATSGSVGFDQTLDLVAEIPVPLPKDLPAERKILRALSGQTVRVPIGGTLSEPKLDVSRFQDSVLDLVQGTLQNLGANAAKDAVDQGAAEAVRIGEQLLENLPFGGGQLLEGSRERRDTRHDQRADDPANAPAQQPAEPTRGAIRGLIDRFRRPASEPTD